MSPPKASAAPQNSRNPVADAERMRARALIGGRWYGGYLAAIGVVSAIYIILIETAFTDGFARALAGGAWALFVILAAYWAERRAAFPHNASRYMWLAVGTWFAAYLLLVGPFVRGLYSDQPLPWMVASALVSLPFFVAAARILTRR